LRQLSGFEQPQISAAAKGFQSSFPAKKIEASLSVDEKLVDSWNVGSHWNSSDVKTTLFGASVLDRKAWIDLAVPRQAQLSESETSLSRAVTLSDISTVASESSFRATMSGCLVVSGIVFIVISFLGNNRRFFPPFQIAVTALPKRSNRISYENISSVSTNRVSGSISTRAGNPIHPFEAQASRVLYNQAPQNVSVSDKDSSLINMSMSTVVGATRVLHRNPPQKSIVDLGMLEAVIRFRNHRKARLLLPLHALTTFKIL